MQIKLGLHRESLKFLFYYLVIKYRSMFLIPRVLHYLKDIVFVLVVVYFRLQVLFNVKIFFPDHLSV